MQVKRVKFKKVSVEDFAEILKMGAEAERKRMLEIVENRRIWHKGECRAQFPCSACHILENMKKEIEGK